MSVSVRDARSSRQDRNWMEGVYRDYLDDLEPDGSGVFPALAEIGHSGADQLSRWFSDLSAVPLLILQSASPVGFAIIARATARRGQVLGWRMAEFFIARPYRRRGIGERAVQLILDRFRGPWEITEYLRNPGAVQFWRRVVAAYTGGRFLERIENGEVRHSFDSGAPAR
jgi:predicted acetyltransferase